MPTNYVLIDFENVQPKNLELLSKHPFRIFVFLGSNQTKVPVGLVTGMQALGQAAEYIRISGNGRNALDFHIACYVGELSAKDPDGHFHIISKDSGFDTLIQHLTSRKIRVQRESDLAEIPLLRTPVAASDDEKIDVIVRNLKGRGQSKPLKIKTLGNTINTLFTKKLEESELKLLIWRGPQRRCRGHCVLVHRYRLQRRKFLCSTRLFSGCQ